MIGGWSPRDGVVDFAASEALRLRAKHLTADPTAVAVVTTPLRFLYGFRYKRQIVIALIQRFGMALPLVMAHGGREMKSPLHSLIRRNRISNINDTSSMLRVFQQSRLYGGRYVEPRQ